MMSEMEERPEAVSCLGEGPTYSRLRLREYVERLREHGFLPDEPIGLADPSAGMPAT